MMKRRILAFFLISLMCVPSLRVWATDTGGDTDYAPFLESIGITLPADEVELEYPERAITKAEFVYLVVSAMGQNAVPGKEYLTFPDVKLDSWYHDKLILAASRGLIRGHENGFFGVNDTVREEVGGRIILRALGFGLLTPEEGDEMKLPAEYPGVYNRLLRGVERDGTVTLGEAYRMIYNMLDSDYVAQDLASVSSYYIETEKTYLEAGMHLKMLSGRITGSPQTDLGIGGSGKGDQRIEIDGVTYETLSDSDAIKYLGYGVDFCLDEKEEKVVCILPKAGNEVTEISSTDLISCQISGSSIVIAYENEKGAEKKVTVPLRCDFVYNGEAEGFTPARLDDLRDKKVGGIKIVRYGGAVLLDVMAYETMIVDTVSRFDEMIYGRYGADPVSVAQDGKGYLTVEKDGENYSPYEIKKDDVIEYAVSGSGQIRKITVCDFALTGAVTQNDVSGNKIGIDGVMYPVSNFFNRYRRSADLQFGTKQRFLFNANGELVDIAEDSAEDPGEYVFLIGAQKPERFEPASVKCVTMDAQMVTQDLADKVHYNGLRSSSDDVVRALLSGNTAKKQLIYIRKNSEGKISVIHTADQTDVTGMRHESDLVVLEAVERNRKCKQQSAWLIDDNDEHFPEFYTDSDTKILMVPVSDAEEDLFQDESCYEVKKISYFKDAENYIVEAYNYDDYNVAGVMLLRQAQTFDSNHSNNSMVLVKSVGQAVDVDGEVVPCVEGYQNGMPVEIKLKDESVLQYINQPFSMKNYDVVRFNLDNNGYAIHAEYIRNVETDCAITDTPDGRNDGNAYVIGTVASRKDNYLKLRFTGAAPVLYRVFRGNPTDITVLEGGRCFHGTMEDLTPGSLVLIRVFYTTLRDVIVIK